MQASRQGTGPGPCWGTHCLHVATAALASLLAALAGVAPAAAAEDKTWDAHYQATWIWQQKPASAARYSGPNSLQVARERAYTFSSTAFLGWQPAPGLEIWFNPELVQGVPLSGLHGLGGMTNGEQQKSSGPDPTLYRARLFLRKTWTLDGETEQLAAGANQFQLDTRRRRFVLTAGNLAITDIFDANAYAHDPRTQFLNWSFLTHGAFDFAADARGYSWGLAGEYYLDQWVVRAGRFMQPEQSNGLPLDKRLLRHYGDQLELEHAHRIAGMPGKLRALVFRNHVRAGSFDEAIRQAAPGAAPDLAPVRRDQSKLGAGMALEQELAPDIGMFARASWNDGRTETYAFTEIDRALSAGFAIKGNHWGRAADVTGFAIAVNGLSTSHRRYLAAGGLGAFLGDGALNYGSERIAEVYYSWRTSQRTRLSLDWQRIVNPGYNRDRSPVSVWSLRLHGEM
ncbi:MAG: carbohydrate porin [Paucimonas sp.]|nr:carbohydrate porin [Paucimonas sp.]